VTHGLDRDCAAGGPSSVTLTIAQYHVPCATVSLRIGCMPATLRHGMPLALFLPGIATLINATCLRAIPLTALCDVIVCELPGHGTSGEVDAVSLFAFAGEYAALVDRYIPPPRQIWVIGESFGGLIGAALARLRPDRVDRLILLDTPLCLTRPPLAKLLANHWRNGRSPYLRHIYTEIFGFDPLDGSRCEAVDFHPMLDGLNAECTLLAGSETYSHPLPAEERPCSQVTDGDLSAIRDRRRVTVLPRIDTAGHCLLLDDPWACVASLVRHLAN
jgi:pimeloyl-ACP methyl ester carboxylesterase